MLLFRLSITGFLLAGALYGQTSTGQIDVTIHDTSGAVIPKATVTISGSQTANRVRTLTSNDSGLAEAPLLQPGEYDIVVTASGFEKLLRRSVQVRVGDVVNLTLTLTPGSMSESITITGETPPLEVYWTMPPGRTVAVNGAMLKVSPVSVTRVFIELDGM